MRARIHRGAVEVGGSCVELEQDGQRLVLDIGRPLSSELGDEAELPAVAGMAELDASLLGVVISHGHPDHFGLAPALRGDVPLYMGEAAVRILREAAFYSGAGAELTTRGFLRHREPLELGPFLITPYLVDHSAFDAYALLVEAGGKRLFYTGDIRAHGRKPGRFQELLTSPPGDIDALLLEGTTLGRTPRPDDVTTEVAVEEGVAALCAGTSGAVLACYSPQNIDRLVSLYRAAKRSGRLFVMDLYAADIAKATGRDTIPQAEWEGVRVFVPQRQRVRVKTAGAFERTDRVRGRRIYPEALAGSAPKLLMTFRSSMAPDLERADCLAGATCVWSMWRGYLESEAGLHLRRWLDDRGIPLTAIHASGHAPVEDLRRLTIALAARQVVPIHTDRPAAYETLFPEAEIERRKDGEWWEI